MKQALIPFPHTIAVGETKIWLLASLFLKKA